MKILCVFVLAGLVLDDAVGENIWLRLTSMSIAEAVHNAANQSLIQVAEAVHNAANQSLIQVAESLALNELVDMINKAGLYALVSSTGPFTMFAPVDQAFQDLPTSLFNYLMNNVTALAEVLKYHISDGTMLCKDFKNDQLVPSRQGQDIRINIYDGGKTITASGSPITMQDQQASNGVLSVTGAILLPPAGTISEIVAATADLSLLKEALNAVPAVDKALAEEGPFTLFAPSDQAFRLLPENCRKALLKHTLALTEILSYHMLPNTAYSASFTVEQDLKTVMGEFVHVTKLFGFVEVNHSQVKKADVSAKNGVIHVIDQVLFPKVLIDFCNPWKKDSSKSYSTDTQVLKFLRRS